MVGHSIFWLIVIAIGIVLIVWADPIDKPSKEVNFIESVVRSVLGMAMFLLGLYNILR